MTNAIHIDIDAHLVECPPWDQSIPETLRQEIAPIVAMRIDCTSMYDQIDSIAREVLSEKGFDAKKGWYSAALLERKYGTWGEHEDFARADWGAETVMGDTSLGYWDWVVQQIETHEDDVRSDPAVNRSISATPVEPCQ